MISPSSTIDAPLVVLAGESIVCPGCGAVLLTFAESVYGMDGLQDAVQPATAGGFAVCCKCGCTWSDQRVDERLVCHITEAIAPRIHLRSADGAWTGWRGLGGE